MFSITFPSLLPNRFTDSIKLKGIIVVGGEDGYHPNKMRLWVQRERNYKFISELILLWILYSVDFLFASFYYFLCHLLTAFLFIQTVMILLLLFSYKNREHMTFDDVGMVADQEFELQPDPTGTLEYTTKWEDSSFLLLFILLNFFISL